MPATPGEPKRRTQRRDQRKEWSALDTASGFERCVRATLRELYGYVALLSGRDRREAERVVSDVYRSLFRAAGAGHVTSVTLGALRSAARQAWVQEHRIELAVIDEVSRAPVSTIAELSALERAVLVFRQVNGMTTDRAASELGRSEREIAALDAHAVRRLRGTDDTSGAWLRAYLGPSVSPTAGLVDRIVRHLAEPDPEAGPAADTTDEPTAPIEMVGPVAGDDVADRAADDAGDDARDAADVDVDDGEGVGADDGADRAADDAGDDARDAADVDVDDGEGVGADDGADDGDGAAGSAGGTAAGEAAEDESLLVEAAETTELPVVDRPTVELPTVVMHASPDSGPDPSSPDPSPDPAPDPSSPDPSPDPSELLAAAPPDDVEANSQPDLRRPRWALAIGAVLVAGLVVALVWLALRGDPGDTVVSTPETSADAAAGSADDDQGAGQSGDDGGADGEGDDADDDDADDDDGAAATSQPDVAASVPAGPVELGFDPPCVERSGTEPGVFSWSGTLDTLGTEPVLQIDLPESVDVDAEPDRAPPRPTAILRPDGVVVAVQPAAGHQADQTMIARVGLDGTVAWVRCFDGLLRVGSAPDVGVDLALRSGTGELAWTTLSIVDGTLGDELDAVQSGVLDAPPPASSDGDVDGPSLGFSYDSALGRSVLAGLDGGSVVWTAPDVLLPDDDAFRATTVGATALAQSCAAADDTAADDTAADDTAADTAAADTAADTADDTAAAGTAADTAADDTAADDDPADDCGAGELRGYDLDTGELLWSRSGSHAVVASGDGVALVGDGSTWELIDVGTGAAVDGRRWDDPTTFETGDDADVGYVVQHDGALVVAWPGTVSVWLPGEVDDAPIRVAIP